MFLSSVTHSTHLSKAEQKVIRVSNLQSIGQKFRDNLDLELLSEVIGEVGSLVLLSYPTNSCLYLQVDIVPLSWIVARPTHSTLNSRLRIAFQCVWERGTHSCNKVSNRPERLPHRTMEREVTKAIPKSVQFSNNDF